MIWDAPTKGKCFLSSYPSLSCCKSWNSSDLHVIPSQVETDSGHFNSPYAFKC